MRGIRVERYEHHYVETDPPCSSCQGPTERAFSSFGIVWTGEISSKYIDRSVKGSDKLKDGGHWVWERNTPDGKPRPRRIETFQQQREFCKSEGLINPTEVSNNIEPKEGGKGLVNNRGLPGTEI